MIKEILSSETCAGCGVCCLFLDSERWEMPHITDELMAAVSAERPELQYEMCGLKRVFKHIPVENGFLRCPVLGADGCKLGDDKPFECKLWPFRATRLGDGVAVTVSHFCKSVYGMPLSELCVFFENKLRAYVIGAVRDNPNILTDYKAGYPIIGYIFGNEI